MIKKHPSSVATFFGIYLAVSLVVGIAIFALYRSHEKALKEAEQLLAANKKAVPEPPPKPKAPPKKTPEKSAPKKGKKTPPKPSQPPVEKPKPPEEDPRKSLEEEIAAMFPFPPVTPLHEIVDDWKTVPKRAFPSFVTIKKPVEFKVKQNGLIVAEGKIPAGSSMIPLELREGQLLLSLSRVSEMTATLPVSDTDFRERIERKYDAFVERQKAETLRRRQAELERREKETTHEAAMLTYNDGSDPRFDPLKASINRGEAGLFDIESAAKWKWAGVEVHGNQEYQTAFVIMVQENVFGSTEHELKALILDGKVVSWIDAATGEPI